MGISRLTALIIQTNEINVEIYSSGNKYGYILSRMENENYRQLVSSKPVFSTMNEANTSAKGLLKSIRETDLLKE